MHWIWQRNFEQTYSFCICTKLANLRNEKCWGNSKIVTCINTMFTCICIFVGSLYSFSFDAWHDLDYLSCNRGMKIHDKFRFFSRKKIIFKLWVLFQILLKFKITWNVKIHSYITNVNYYTRLGTYFCLIAINFCYFRREHKNFFLNSRTPYIYRNSYLDNNIFGPQENKRIFF